MSEVTNVIFTFSSLEYFDERIAQVNQWLATNEHLPFRDVWRNGECVGGAKNMEVPLYAGAFSYFPMTEFIEFLRTLPWKEPDSVQVIACGQHDRTWRIIAA